MGVGIDVRDLGGRGRGRRGLPEAFGGIDLRSSIRCGIRSGMRPR
jgi:hypothetical protein